MFFFIGGIGRRTVTLDPQPRTCPNCGRLALYSKRIDSYLTVFFVPLFTVKKGEPFLVCGNCRATYDERGGRKDGGQTSKEQACQYCGRPRESNFKYCPECGKPIIYGTRTQ